MQAERISRTQAVLLIINLRLTFAFLSLSINTPPGNQDIWLAELGSMLYALCFYLPLFYLNKEFPGKSLRDYPEKIVGKYLGRTILALYVGFILFLAVLNTVNFSVFVGAVLMPETPAIILLILMIIPCIYAAYKGIVNIVWTGQIIFPIVMILILLINILGIELLDFKVLLPVFQDSTLYEIHTGSYSFALCFHDGFLLFLLIPYLQNQKIGKDFILALLGSTALFLVISIFPLLTLGVEQAKHSIYPFYIFSRQIQVFDFIERIESFIVTSWIMVELFKISVYSYFAAEITNQIFRTKSHHKFIIPFAAMVTMISLSKKLYSSEVINKLISYQVFPYVSIIFIFLIPLLLAIIHSLKKVFRS